MPTVVLQTKAVSIIYHLDLKSKVTTHRTKPTFCVVTLDRQRSENYPNKCLKIK